MTVRISFLWVTPLYIGLSPSYDQLASTSIAEL